MKFEEYLNDSYRSFDMVKPPRKRNMSGAAAPIEVYADPLDPSKIKTKTKRIIYGFSMGLYRPYRSYKG